MPQNSEDAIEPMDPEYRAELLASMGDLQRMRDRSDEFLRGRENEIAAYHGLPLPHPNIHVQIYGDTEPAGINNYPEIFDIYIYIYISKLGALSTRSW